MEKECKKEKCCHNVRCMHMWVDSEARKSGLKKVERKIKYVRAHSIYNLKLIPV